MTTGARKKRWNNLGVRLLTAIFVALICIVPLYFGGWAWALLVAAFSARVLFEWIRMTDPAISALGRLIAFAGLIAALLYAAQGLPVWSIGAMILATVVAIFERRSRDGWVWTAIGLPYVIIPAVVLILLRGDAVGFDTAGFTQIIFIILIVIAADVGAYFGGSTFQGPKLAPTLSPNKTWSGVFSGLLLAVLMACGVGALIGLPLWLSTSLAVPIVILSVLGDLLESAFKRRLGIKDTGSLLPGHGGLLDRLDSLMAAIVGGALLYMIIGTGWPLT